MLLERNHRCSSFTKHDKIHLEVQISWDTHLTDFVFPGIHGILLFGCVLKNHLKNTSNEVKELVIKINELDRDDKLKFISYVFNLWDRDQINSLSEVNPSLLDDSIDIEIFNPSSIDYRYLLIEIKEYWNYKYSLYRLYTKKI